MEVVLLLLQLGAGRRGRGGKKGERAGGTEASKTRELVLVLVLCCLCGLLAGEEYHTFSATAKALTDPPERTEEIRRVDSCKRRIPELHHGWSQPRDTGIGLGRIKKKLLRRRKRLEGSSRPNEGWEIFVWE
jgi:hypothetical protein